MNIELNCIIDDEVILDEFKNIKIVLDIETKYNRESSDEYILFYPVEDEVEINIDSEYIEPNIIYSNSNLQIFFNKDNPYWYHIGKTHYLRKTVFIGVGTALYNLFNEVLTAKGLIKKDYGENIIVTEKMRTAIKDTIVIFDVEPCETGYSISNVNVVGWSKIYCVPMSEEISSDSTSIFSPGLTGMNFTELQWVFNNINTGFTRTKRKRK